jgi:hypothetical protein
VNTLTPPEKSARVRDVNAAMSTGMSLNNACKACAVSPASFLRWRDALAAAGGDAFTAFAAGKPTGRPAAVEFSEQDLAIARWHRLCKGSINIAVYFFCRDADASPATVAALRSIEEKALESGKEPAWPMSVRRAFEVTEDEWNRFRGTKAAQESEMVTRRGMLWIDEAGTLQNLLPGELWELDDYSANQPFTYLDPQTGELNVGRQILAGMDVCGAGWLGFDLIGRPRDAYRGEDIVRFIGRLFRAHGVPRFLRLERGSWESSYVHGIEVDGRTWGALDALCHIDHVWKSKGKGTLEGSFNPLQNWLAHAGRDVGRHAGEFQESAKAWRQAKNAASKPDPRLLGFWSQEDAAAAHEEAARIMNSRPRERKAHGERVAADDLRARHGWNTTPLPAAEAWRLLPCKQRRVVNAGHVMVNPGGGWPELSFVLNGIDGLCLESGHAVLVACDPADPAAGAYVCNADTGARNRRGWGWGEVICAAAPLVDLAPQINLSGKRHGTLDLRRQAAAAAATEFRAVTAGAPGRREVSVFNGAGLAATAGDLDRPAAAVPATGEAPAAPRPAVREGLAAPVRGNDLAALFGGDKAAQLAAMEAKALEHF